MKPGKLPRNKQRSHDLCWKVHDPAQSFVLCSHNLAELRNRHVCIAYHDLLCFVQGRQGQKSEQIIEQRVLPRLITDGRRQGTMALMGL